jgi:CHAT domain-containing protein
MPFLEEELTEIAASLKPRGSEARLRGSDFVFETHQFRSRAEIQQTLSNEERSMLDRFRIVHFSGHFRGSHDGNSEGRYETLDIDGTPQVIWQLEPMLNNALLVLDGCGSAKGLTAWAEVEGLTSKLINAFGVHSCVVTVLPHKHDPIASKVFWKAFYSDLLVGVKSPGHALMTARKKLRRHCEEIGSNNPMWANFQLIGNPAVPLLAGDDEDEDNE